jgi:transmembrane sensor
MNTSKPTAAELARLHEAAEWVQRLNGSTDPALADTWMEWCAQDPLNFAAFDRMQQVWDGFPPPRAPIPQPAVSPRSAARRNRLIAVAASVLVLCVAVGWFAQRQSGSLAFTTAVGEQQHEILPDGSHIDLAPDSTMRVRFSLLRREIRLDRGQAYFAVSHDVLRPFIVHAHDVTAVATGTAFDVRTGPNATVVTVSEGRVSVRPSDAAAAAGGLDLEPLRAGAGQQVTFTPSARRLSVMAVDPRVYDSWRTGTLQFVGQPLREVVGEVDRFVKRRIVVAAALQDIRFTGTVSPAKITEWLDALKQIYAVQIVDEGESGIYIQSRDHDAPHRSP